jgi:hypothetical protein
MLTVICKVRQIIQVPAAQWDFFRDSHPICCTAETFCVLIDGGKIDFGKDSWCERASVEQASDRLPMTADAAQHVSFVNTLARRSSAAVPP